MIWEAGQLVSASRQGGEVGEVKEEWEGEELEGEMWEDVKVKREEV